jgi:ketosteroid isomerase-like protein
MKRSRSARLPAGATLAVLAVLGILGIGACKTGQPAPPRSTATAPVGAQTPAEAEKEIMALDARRITAMVHKDIEALRGLLRDDLTYVHSGGPIETKAQILDELTTGKLHYDAIEQSEHAMRFYGETAVMTGRALLKATSGKRPVNFPIRFTAVWVRTQGTWQLAAWQSTKIQER